MYTATGFAKGARQPTVDKYFKEKQTSGMKCELMNEKSLTV
jgi:hypothetical protein